MVQLIHELDAGAIAARLRAIRAEIIELGRHPDEVEILAAVKYVPVEELGTLWDAGIKVLGENRAQGLEAKASAHPQFTCDFIGNLQSRKVRQVLRHVRYIHSVATDSVLEQLRRHAGPRTRVLVEVNVSGEPGKGGVAPEALASFRQRCPVEVVGLMTMPPHTADPEASRPYFAALRELADAHGLRHLSMGTSQDYRIALSEGATIVRLGSSLYRQPDP